MLFRSRKMSPRRADKKIGNIYSEFIERKPSVIVKIDKRGIYVAAGEGIVIIKRVKPEGRKEMDAYAFSCGRNLKVGEAFE